MAPSKKSRKFGGKTYYWVTERFRKSKANRVAEYYRGQGYNARVTKAKRKRGGRTRVMYDIWTNPRYRR